MKTIAITIVISILFLGFTSKSKKISKASNQVSIKESLTDDELLTEIQYHTFQYFWEGAHKNSGMAMERIGFDFERVGDNDVTTGGTGFGLMSILVGIERDFITLEEGIVRIKKIVNFLESADRFHGVWPHWMDGNTGKVKTFSEHDDGGDLVETAFLIQGLFTVKEYLLKQETDETELLNQIDKLWREVEWSWYTKGEDVLYWHWSPNHGWKMNFEIDGYDEALITYVLAASSPTYPISSETYYNGWTAHGNIVNTESNEYNISMPLKHNVHGTLGGPLFWAHYSFLGLNPTNLKGKYCNYWDNNVKHTKLQKKYCVRNPNNYKGYSDKCWGLTASYSIGNLDEVKSSKKATLGYSAHHPGNDLGVISPTAAISSLPYAPEDVMPVIRYFYEELGNELFGKYGFYDAFSIEYNWFPNEYLAIDQGPIVIMIENYRTQLLWNLFMKNKEIQNGLSKLGISYQES